MKKILQFSCFPVLWEGKGANAGMYDVENRVLAIRWSVGRSLLEGRDRIEWKHCRKVKGSTPSEPVLLPSRTFFPLAADLHQCCTGLQHLFALGAFLCDEANAAFLSSHERQSDLRRDNEATFCHEDTQSAEVALCGGGEVGGAMMRAASPGR